MRFPVFFLLLVTYPSSTTPTATITILELGAKIVELKQALLETLFAIDKTEASLERAENRKEKLLFGRLASINDLVQGLTQQLHGAGNHLNVMVQISNNSPEIAQLESIFKYIRETQFSIDVYYNTTAKFVADFDEYEKSTLVKFANTVVSHSPNSVPYLIKRIYSQVTRTDFLDLFYKHFQPKPQDYFCNGKQSLQQTLHHFMNEILLINTKCYILTEVAYMIKKIYKHGNFRREIRDTNEEFQTRTNNLTAIMKPYISKSSPELWRCDPEKHTKDQTYVEITNFLHGYILNEANLNPHEQRDRCERSTVTYGNLIKCEDYWCKRQNKCPKIVNCHTADSSMTVCLKSMSKDHRRYDYIQFGSGKTYGRKKTCTKEARNLVRISSKSCSYCFCLCDEGPKYYSDRYINLLRTMSNITDNRVVTGVRFVKRNQIIYLQVQEGKLLSLGRIDLDTIRWVPLTEYEKSDKNDGHYYHTLSWESRGFDLANILADDGYVVTGVQFKVVGTRVHLEILQTPFNFTTGLLNRYGNYPKHDLDLQYKHPYGQELKLIRPDVPIHSRLPSTDFTTNQYVKITHTDFDKDAGQTAVPFFDAQPVESATPGLLQGIGMFHKGRRGSGGFIALKIFTYNYTQHFESVFPRNKSGKFIENDNLSLED